MTFESNRSASRRRAAAGTAVALAAATLSVGLAGPASAANTVELEGTVVGSAGQPVEGVRVQAVDATDANNAFYPTYTDAAGHYQLDNLPTGSVKLIFSDDTSVSFSSPLPYTTRWSGGASSYATATSVAVTQDPATPVTVPTMSLSQRYGAISGTLTADGRPASDPNLFLIGLDDNVDGDQSITQGLQTSGASYRMLVLPGSVRAAVEAYDTQSDPANPVYFIRKWWQNTYSEADATTINVASGQTVTGVDFALTRSLAATRAPQILGFPAVGRALTAAPGTWSQMANTQYTYTWLRGATVVGTGATYVPTQSDLGSRLTLRVTAGADKFAWYHNAGEATVTSAVVRYPAKARVGAKALSGRRVAVHLTLVSAKQSPVRGKVVILRNGHVIRTGLKLSHGKVALVLKHQPKGRKTYTVRYQGNKRLAKVQRSFTVRVHK